MAPLLVTTVRDRPLLAGTGINDLWFMVLSVMEGNTLGDQTFMATFLRTTVRNWYLMAWVLETPVNDRSFMTPVFVTTACDLCFLELLDGTGEVGLWVMVVPVLDGNHVCDRFLVAVVLKTIGRDWFFMALALGTTLHDRSFIALVLVTTVSDWPFLAGTGKNDLWFLMVSVLEGNTMRDRTFVAVVLRSTVRDWLFVALMLGTTVHDRPFIAPVLVTTVSNLPFFSHFDGTGADGLWFVVV